ncbi:hypothetical protein A2U01_0109088, partial [Trifolium medium]|nr:hypothetical protein [Trifolium medium]
ARHDVAKRGKLATPRDFSPETLKLSVLVSPGALQAKASDKA